MPKYQVVNVLLMRITSTYVVEADDINDAEDKVDSDLGTLINTHEKYVDGDCWVTEIK